MFWSRWWVMLEPIGRIPRFFLPRLTQWGIETSKSPASIFAGQGDKRH